MHTTYPENERFNLADQESLTYGGQISSRVNNKSRIWPLNEAAVTQTKKYSDLSFLVS